MVRTTVPVGQVVIIGLAVRNFLLDLRYEKGVHFNRVDGGNSYYDVNFGGEFCLF